VFHRDGAHPDLHSFPTRRSSDLLDRLFGVLNIATIVAIAIAGIMLLCAMLLIATTIRLSAFSRRRETGIMRLVGASNTFIQMPRSEEHTSELQSRENLVCRLLLE